MGSNNTTRVAVAIITDEPLQRVFLTWNDKWGAFTLPMTKVRTSSKQSQLETPKQAALRAASEVLGVPVRHITPPPTAEPTSDVRYQRYQPRSFRIEPNFQVEVSEAELTVKVRSGRDRREKVYEYHLFRVEPHPHFAAQPFFFRVPHVWASPYAVLGSVGDSPFPPHSCIYEPLSPSVPLLLDCARQTFPLPERVQQTTTLWLTQPSPDGPTWLLRWSRGWEAYSLPARRRDPTSALTPPQLVEELVRLELGVEIPDLTIRPVQIELDGVPSGNLDPELRGVATHYEHLIVEGIWSGKKQMSSKQPLHWATADEIMQGRTAALHPQPISPTASQIAQTLGEPTIARTSEAIARAREAAERRWWNTFVNEVMEEVEEEARAKEARAKYPTGIRAKEPRAMMKPDEREIEADEDQPDQQEE